MKGNHKEAETLYFRKFVEHKQVHEVIYQPVLWEWIEWAIDDWQWAIGKVSLFSAKFY